MSLRRYLNLDFGIPNLIPEWKKLFSKQYLLDDINAGLTVACVAIPLSLAIALASGVSPAVGLVTAIIGGIVCALFGGTPLAVSGPAAAMTILIANSVEKFGVKGLVFICLVIGLMQLLSGVLRLGRLSRFVPLPVIAAFTSGIGVIIIIGQLPRIFGLSQPATASIFSVISHLWQYLSSIQPVALIVVAVTITIIRLLPKVLPKIPAAIIAVIAATSIVHLFSLSGLPVIGDIPRTLPMPKLPSMAISSMGELMLTTFTIYMLACLETLLSSSAIDKLIKVEKHDPDQELIGQGLGNIVSSLFGGIPLTGVIARSAVNVKSGAKTRRASIIHSIVLLLAVFFAAPLIAMIPIAALAGVLVSVAFSMINYQEFRNLLRTSHSEAAIYAVTFLMIIFVDLTAGIQVGILAACLIILVRASKNHMHISSHSKDAVRLSLHGPLTFLSMTKVSELEKNLQDESPSKPIILDLSDVTDLDSSGASAIIDFVNNFHNRDFNVFLKGLPRRFESLFMVCEGEKIFEECYISSESELKDKLSLKSFHGRLLHGVQKFHADIEGADKRLYEHIANRQDPHTLFITCSDSRILTSMITQSDPGELFIVRNVGNFIPPYNPEELHSEVAALEFALTQLDIREIVICGHSNCGAMKAASEGNLNLPAQLTGWVDRIKSQLNLSIKDVNELAKQNVMNQIGNLKQYSLVKQKLEKKSLNIHGWFIDLEQHVIFEWNERVKSFTAIGAEGTAMPKLLNADKETVEVFN
ncbi:MAG: bifunctional SulP family inorganic anion transporter/carbonic anhydrase [Gammaproteobacteria bacterium]|nr:bifunctional SulP family inorganic anion transporter/carbonic anhydrase [Gammaproteobacteria bacterium]